MFLNILTERYHKIQLRGGHRAGLCGREDDTLHRTFTRQRSVFSDRLLPLSCCTNRLKNSSVPVTIKNIHYNTAQRQHRNNNTKHLQFVLALFQLCTFIFGTIFISISNVFCIYSISVSNNIRIYMVNIFFILLVNIVCMCVCMYVSMNYLRRNSSVDRSPTGQCILKQ